MLIVLLSAAAGYAQSLAVHLEPAQRNPSAPKMGDHLAFESVITNTSSKAVRGLIAWISLLRVDPGREQPMDLEDWSAQKAVAEARLDPGQSLETVWPVRLIQPGDYRVVISALGRNVEGLTTSRLVSFSVSAKPVVESSRIVPLALGVPLVVGMLLLWRCFRSQRPATQRPATGDTS